MYLVSGGDIVQLIFIRHGQGEHTLNIPQSLYSSDPKLTNNGVDQAQLLKKLFPLTNQDIIVISPLRRTLQTALIWSGEIKCHKIASPLVSPRMFPQKTNCKTLPCDEVLDKETIKTDFPDFQLEEGLSVDLWKYGINTLTEEVFNALAGNFIQWCKNQDRERIFIVSHDGTITSYRQYISGKKLTRDDFPKETEWIKIEC